MGKIEYYRLVGDRVIDSTGKRLVGFISFTHVDEWDVSENGEYTLIQKYKDGRWKTMKLIEDPDING